MKSLRVKSYAKIHEVMTAVPRTFVKTSEEKGPLFEKLTGIKERRVTNDYLDLAVKAAQRIINHQSTDAIIFCSQSQKGNIPATANYLAEKLALGKGVYAVDLVQSCSGYIYATFQGLCLINSGMDRVLIINADNLSSLADKGSTESSIFGAAASATMMVRSDELLEYEFEFYTDGSGFFDLHNQDGKLTMKGEKVFDFTMTKVLDLLNSFWDRQSPIVLHQANKQIIDRISKRLETEIFCNIESLGNCSSVSIPLVLTDLKFKPEPILTLCGFGAGLSVALCRLPWTAEKRGTLYV